MQQSFINKEFNFKGPKILECYMKKKRQKTNKMIFQKTSYKYFMIDLELEKFCIKINKESKNVSKEFNLNSMEKFKKNLDEEDENICDYKFGFSIFIAGKKYVLYQKEERENHNWIRIFEYYFNCNDIGPFENYKLKQKNEMEIRKKIQLELMNAYVPEEVKEIPKENLVVENDDEIFNEKCRKRDKYNKSRRSVDAIDTSDKNKLQLEIHFGEKIGDDNKKRNTLVNANEINVIKDANYYRKKYEEEKLQKLKRLSTCKNDIDNQEAPKIIKKNDNHYKVTLEPDYSKKSNISDKNDYAFEEVPIVYKYTMIQHNDNNGTCELLKIPNENQNKENDKENKNQFPEVIINNQPTVRSKYTKETLIKDINEKKSRNETIKNTIKEKLSIRRSSMDNRKCIPKSNDQRLDSRFFNEKPIKQDIEKDKIILENLHFGLNDTISKNNFNDTLNVTIAGVSLNRINKINFSEKIKEEISPKKIKRKEEEFYDERKTITTNKGKVLNVKKNFVENENDIGWTLNFSVIEEKRNRNKSNNDFYN